MPGFGFGFRMWNLFNAPQDSQSGSGSSTLSAFASSGAGTHYHPQVEGGCVLCLDARHLAPGAVTTWPDESVSAADYDGTGHTPTASATGLNGHPSVGAFDTTHYLVKTSYAGLNGKTTATFYMAAHWPVGATRCPFNVGINPGIQVIGDYLAGNDRLGMIDNGAAYSQDTGEATGAAVWTVTFDRAGSPKVDFYESGVAHNDAQVNGATVGNWAAADSRIGAYTATPLYGFTSGEIGMIVLFDTVHDAAARGRVEAFMSAIWGI